MELIPRPRVTLDLRTTPIHLGLGSQASAIAGFGWGPDELAAYAAAVVDDGPDGRLVTWFAGDRSWDAWERHPAGDEVVICVSGRMTMIVERDDGEHESVVLGPGEALVNPAGAWHTADVDGPVEFVTITPGLGTEHRPRRSTR